METQARTANTFIAEAPANIALLKYWGKDDAARQWPSNDSISMTLTQCRTRTKACLHDGDDDVVYLQGEQLSRTARHGMKIFAQLDFLRQACGFTHKLGIETHNSFPLACGIASSASGMAALTLAALACWTEQDSWAGLAAAGWTRARLAALARQGSGSACRSLWGGLVHWQRGASPNEQSVYQLEDENYLRLCDIIVTPTHVAKAVSSSAGHARAHSSPLFAVRLAGMQERQRDLLAALALRDVERLGCLIEQEALEFCQVMSTSTPPLVYAGKETFAFMTWLRQCRQRGDFVAYFTVDAGVSVHVLCAASAAEHISQAIRTTFPHYEVITDTVGRGPWVARASGTSEDKQVARGQAASVTYSRVSEQVWHSGEIG